MKVPIRFRGMKAMATAALALASTMFGAKPASAAWPVPMPNGYTEVTYIESSDAGGDWIDTEYQPTLSTRIEASLNVKTIGGNPSILFSSGGKNGRDQCIKLSWKKVNNSGKIFGCFCNNADDVGLREDVANNSDIELTLRLGSMTVNGVTTELAHAGSPSLEKNRNIFLFTGNNKGSSQNGGNMRLYWFKIYEGDATTPSCDLVPCIDDQGAAGLWDRAAGKFLANKMDGSAFKVGEVVQVASSDPVFDVIFEDKGLTSYGLVGRVTGLGGDATSARVTLTMNGVDEVIATDVTTGWTFSRRLTDLEPGETYSYTITVLNDQEASKAFNYSFTLNANAGLPAGYTRLRAVETDGNFYCDTGICYASDLVIDCLFSAPNGSGYSALFGTGFGDHCPGFTFYPTFFNLFTACNWTEQYTTLYSADVEHEIPMHFVIDSIQNSFTYNTLGDEANVTKKDLKVDANKAANYLTTPMYLFAVNNGTKAIDVAFAGTRIYSFVARQGEATAYEMIPCTDSSGAVGLYNTKTSAFISGEDHLTGLSLDEPYPDMLPSGAASVNGFTTSATLTLAKGKVGLFAKSCDVYLTLGEGAETKIVEATTFAEDVIYSIDGLASDTTYAYTVRIVNDLGNAKTFSGSFTTLAGTIPLPETYTRLRAVETDGKFYCNTGICYADDLTIDCVFSAPNWSGYSALFGTRFGSEEEGFMLYPSFYINSTLCFWSGKGGLNGVVEHEIPMHIVITSTQTTYCTLGDEAKAVTKNNTVNAAKAANYLTTPMSLFAANNGTQADVNKARVGSRIYSFVAQRSGADLCEMVPCTNPSGTVGLWNTMTGEFISGEGHLTGLSMDAPDPNTNPFLVDPVVAADSSAAAVSVQIRHPGIGATSCDVYLTLGEGAETQIGTGIATGESATGTVTGLAPETTYAYTLRVVNDKGLETTYAGTVTTSPVPALPAEYDRAIYVCSGAIDGTDEPVLVTDAKMMEST